MISFVFADLITLPLLLIYRRYYGRRLTLNSRTVLNRHERGRTRGRITMLPRPGAEEIDGTLRWWYGDRAEPALVLDEVPIKDA